MSPKPSEAPQSLRNFLSLFIVIVKVIGTPNNNVKWGQGQMTLPNPLPLAAEFVASF